MNNKKIFVSVLSMLLVIVLSGCSGELLSFLPESDKSTETTAETSQQTQEPISVSDLDIEMLSCSFDNEVMGYDEEISNYGYTKRDGKVYVNLALKVKNNGESTIGEDDFKGYFEYNELRYDLQYELASVAPQNNNDETIPPKSVAIIHMLSVVEEAAMQQNLEVTYTVAGNEFKQNVAPVDTRDALSKKTEVLAGDKLNVDNLYDVEVVEYTEKQYLRASNFEESEQYSALGDKKFVDLVLKVKNNTEVELKDIKSYIFVDDQGTYANVEIETNNNTSLESLNIKPLQPGQEGYIHIYATVENDMNTSDLAMRFNLAGNCYYCKIK